MVRLCWEELGCRCRSPCQSPASLPISGSSCESLDHLFTWRQTEDSTFKQAGALQLMSGYHMTLYMNQSEHSRKSLIDYCLLWEKKIILIRSSTRWHLQCFFFFLRTQWLGPSLHLGLGCVFFCLYCDSSVWTMDLTQIVLLQHELAISSQSRNIRAGSALHLSLIPWSSRVFIRIISIAVAICPYGYVHIIC